MVTMTESQVVEMCLQEKSVEPLSVYSDWLEQHGTDEDVEFSADDIRDFIKSFDEDFILRSLALIKGLGESLPTIQDITMGYLDGLVQHGNNEYFVLTDEEADTKAKERIVESLWAFRASFLSSETDMPESIFEALAPLGEDANEGILAIVEKTVGIDRFVEAAISADGRAHFLADYDGEKLAEVGDYFIYQSG